MQPKSNAKFLGHIISEPLQIVKSEYSEKETTCKGCMGPCGQCDTGNTDNTAEPGQSESEAITKLTA